MSVYLWLSPIICYVNKRMVTLFGIKSNNSAGLVSLVCYVLWTLTNSFFFENFGFRVFAGLLLQITHWVRNHLSLSSHQSGFIILKMRLEIERILFLENYIKVYRSFTVEISEVLSWQCCSFSAFKRLIKSLYNDICGPLTNPCCASYSRWYSLACLRFFFPQNTRTIGQHGLCFKIFN